MASVFHENFSIEFLLDVPATLSKPKQNWHSAFAKIYYSRTPHSLPKNAAENESFKIDQTTLKKLVDDKNIHQLRHFGGTHGVVSALETDINAGIIGSEEDVVRRQVAFGSNTYEKPPTKSFFHFVAEAFKDLTILILLGCAALSLAFGSKQNGLKVGCYDSGSIFVAVFLVIVVSAISNFRQNSQFDKLSKDSNNIQIEVIRKGCRQQISIFEIVVGDVTCLKNGDQIPADGLFLEGHSLQVDESSMTGESNLVEVNSKQNPFLLSGTKVVDGYGCMLATSVGMNTTWGQLMSQISRDIREETPLQARLNKLTSSIGKAGLAVALLVLVVLLVRYFTGNTTDDNGNREFNGSKTNIDDVVNAVVRIVAVAVTIVVVASPKGLPAAVTLTLAYSMKRMVADKAMLRKLSACETMGSVTTICTDKTGTLTINQMSVTKFWLGKETVIEGAASSISPWVVELIQQGVALNTTGSVYRTGSGSEFEVSGSPTEKAILYWAVRELNMDVEGLKQSCKMLKVEAFNSEKKRSGVLMRKNTDNTIHVHWKGAAEMILAMCSSYYDASGIKKQMDNVEREKIEQIIQGMAASSLRCIAFAHKLVCEEENDDADDLKKLDEDNLSLLGLVGIKDPCRPGAKNAVKYCQWAGVNVKMITGDNVFTAKAIATECGILGPNQDLSSGAVVEGEEFRNYTLEERMKKVDKISVMARSSPLDKLLMVQCLKLKGHVVAVTGDGTNDAPALKEADIGLSMGIQGTEVAKESSDIVILDDSFSSVVRVLRWGRCVYNNIQKFIQFRLTVNVAALVINFVAAVSAGEVPLTAVQLLWINLIVDTLGALALATEKPTDELMDKPPVGRTEPLITDIMWRNLLAQAMYQIAVLLTFQFRGESIFGVNEKVKDTLIFNTFVLCQVFNEFNARKLEKKMVFKGILYNKLFLRIIGIIIVLQVVMVELLKKFANTERLNWGQWGVCIRFAAASWPTGWLVKCIHVPEKKLLFRIESDSLTELVNDKNLSRLQELGGAHGVASALQTDIYCGICGSVEDIGRRKEVFGSNTYKKKQPKRSFFSFVEEAFKDLTVLILFGSATITMALGIKERGLKEGGIDGASIYVVAFLAIAISAFSDYMKYREPVKMDFSRDFQIDVLRNGWTQQISIFEVVVGEVICLKIGDQVPANGLFLDGHSLQVDESSMTGETDHVEVNSSENPFLFSGTKVADGSARMIAISVGMNTEWGQMMSTIDASYGEPTLFQHRLNKLISFMSKLGLAGSCLALVVLLVYYFTGNTTDENGNKEFSESKKKVFSIVKAVIAIVALNIMDIAIPERLQFALQLALAHLMKRMTANKAMVRKLSACDMMGSVSVICIDKTTPRNPIKVTEFWVGRELIIEGAASLISPEVVELIQQGVALNTTGIVYKTTDYQFEDHYAEEAIKSWAIQELDMDVDELNEKCTVLEVKTFHSRKGVLMRKKTDNSLHIHWIGEGETVLAMCSYYYIASGIIKNLDDGKRRKFEHNIQGMAARGLVCIALAYEQNYGLGLLGLVGITSPCLPEVRKVVDCCQHAGVNFKIITSNDIFSARAIATGCGILSPNQDMSSGEVIEGEEFRNYTQEERMNKMDKIRVMARSSPLDKKLMVQCLKQKGHVVAVVGNDMNDAAALKEADVGLSVGIQASQVAKESSDIVILDDNFASVATALIWGRCVNANIQKFIQFQLIVNLVALITNFVAAVSTGKTPLTIVQLFWVNLIIETLGALALSTEQPTKELMERPPMRRSAPLITNVMWRNLLAQVLYQIGILLTLHFRGESMFGVNEKEKDTMIFNTFVLCQVFNEFNSRMPESKNVFRGIKKNKLFLPIILTTLVLQAAMVAFLKRFADIQRLNWSQWCACVAYAAFSWPIDWVVKCMPVSETPISNDKPLKEDDVETDTNGGIIGSEEDVARREEAFGLPVAVTLTLVYSMKRMMVDQAVVRKLSACETMGFTTTICTDKTGTLTLNKMKVTKFWLGKESVREGAASSISPLVVELIQQGVALNTTGSVNRTGSGSEFAFSGSPTEKAILSWAVQELNMDMEESKQSCIVLKVEPFTSERKRSGVLLRQNTDNTIHVHWKGAAEIILAMCSSYYDASGIKKQMDDSEREKFDQIIQGMAASSFRCIVFAHKKVCKEENGDMDDWKRLDEGNLSVLGMMGIKDPCRPKVKKVVEDCQRAGVNIKMITGDNVFTAKAIATECGIFRPDHDLSGGVVVEGEEFRNYTQEERMEKVDNICVMARSSPFDKLLMVQCLKLKGLVVAVTGDGTNDAPALKEANIGLCMGIQGTEVAKESSDIVILDDNFSSVAQLTVNVVALVINFVAAIATGEIPLSAVQLFWVNLIMNTLGALALATEQPTKELMYEPPVGRTEPLVTNIMWRNY
ncbi:hypothetical protein JRO89_XS03G0215200 [Xanthoceras sorbifolium]|uniref:Calcium-transporting ATPase n=1 Tax=Xanthoceras sorbifolium TaxID=99658 RepID=A0ABQ8IBM7_9ROSI|nr:hypothetical protein JRO89_XS03G0215200 [Xanthoceras sorbifolium]